MRLVALALGRKIGWHSKRLRFVAVQIWVVQDRLDLPHFACSQRAWASVALATLGRSSDHVLLFSGLGPDARPVLWESPLWAVIIGE